MKKWNKWWVEAEEPVATQAPATDPNAGPGGTPVQGGALGQDGNTQQAPQQEPQPPQEEPVDVTNDPKEPDMPQDNDDEGFEEWRNNFFKLAVKGDMHELIASAKRVRDRDLDTTQSKFVEDNLQIQWLREDDANIAKISNDVRRMVKDQLDKNYPATSLMQHIHEGLEKMPQLQEIFYKLTGFYGMKGDLHRKYIASLLSAVQVGGGGSREDLVFNDKDYSINISTRFSTEWGEIALGKWNLQIDDPERYLEEPELARLKDGSPEEKVVLRHRIVLNSIAERFKTRAFLMHVVSTDGKIDALGWDIGDSLMSAYQDGKIVVRTKASDGAEGMITDEGTIIPITDLTIRFVKETGKRDDAGAPVKKEFPFLEKINGMLYLTADLEIVRDMASGMQGVFFKEFPFAGNPSDIKALRRCVPGCSELLGRRCN